MIRVILFSPIAKCIDHYTKQCVENADLPEGEKKPIDQRLEGIVNKMFQRCLDDHKYKQAIGIALETRRLDVFEKTILESVGRWCDFRDCFDGESANQIIKTENFTGSEKKIIRCSFAWYFYNLYKNLGYVLCSSNICFYFTAFIFLWGLAWGSRITRPALFKTILINCYIMVFITAKTTNWITALGVFAVITTILSHHPNRQKGARAS